MRVTCDLDFFNPGRFSLATFKPEKLLWAQNPLRLLFVLVKGRLLLGKWPAKVRRSCGGWGVHVIWRGLALSQEQAYVMRARLGDDPARILADRTNGFEAKQVLFSKKVVRFL